jgi:hypothetical protein
MLKELDTVVLTKDLDVYGLKEGDVGAVVHCYDSGKAFEVEFVTAEGTTVAVLTLESDEIRPMKNKEILHAHEITSCAA